MRFKTPFSGSDAEHILDAVGKTLIMMEMDLDGTIRSANKMFFDYFDFDAKSLAGRPHSTFHDADYAASAEYRTMWQKLAAGEFQWCEAKRRNRSGEWVWMQVWYYPILGRNGKPYKIVMLAADVTYDKVQHAEVQSQVDAIDKVQAIIEFSIDGTVLKANRKFLDCIGYEQNEIVGKKHSLFIDPAEAATPQYLEHWQKLKRGEAVTGEFRRIGKGGREVFIQGSYNPVFDMEGRVAKVVKYATEVTGRVVAVRSIGNGLRDLAEGRVTQRIQTPFISELEQLRTDFNASMEALEDALRQVGETASTISGATSEIRVASDDLSRRTEQQAASVEQTAAALQELSDTVRQSTQKAIQAGDLVTRTKSGAEKSGEVVRHAVEAMSKIEASSDEIVSIIGMIDDIAFQTNLLALNAGVEAARAGEAGKGFAVVAQEVRELAQRSANAAKEIKELINQSSEQVKEGVGLVGETGRSLETIVAEVKAIDENVRAIVDNARNQETGLSEINKAVGSIDEGTQQNATMVEETAAACGHLASQAGELTELLSRFDIAQAKAASPARPSASRPASGFAPAAAKPKLPAAKPAAVTTIKPASAVSRPAASPARKLVGSLENAFSGGRSAGGSAGGSARAATARAEDSWEEF